MSRNDIPSLPLRVVLLLCTALTATSCRIYSTRQVSDPAPAVARLRAGGSVEEEVSRLTQPLIDSGEAFGMVVAVLTPDGATHTFGYGRSSRSQGSRPLAGDTIFQVGSLSKVLIATVLAQLVEDGQLHYEDTVRSILPAAVKLPTRVGELTLYELVTHTGGLPRQPAGPSQMAYFIAYLFSGRNLYGYIDKDYLYGYLGRCHLKPRGERAYVYSNIGAGLLAHLIELKTGRSLPDLIQEKVCRPLNLHDTVYVLDAEQKTRLAVGHVGDQPKFVRRGRPVPPWDMGEIMGASGGLYSTANDLMVFAQANLGLLGHPLEPLLAATHQTQIRTPAEDVAYGWLISRFDEGKSTILYKHGMVSGYNAYVGLDPDTRIAVIVLCNTFNWNDKVGHNLVRRLARGLGGVEPGSQILSAQSP
jgi:CubicO group peptidase (beta-lactamase class C family)